MSVDLGDKGKLEVEIKVFNTNKIINLLWQQNIKAENVIKKDMITLTMTIKYSDYDEVSRIVKENKGQIEIINRSLILMMIMKIKNRYSYVIGAALFIFIIYFLSGFIWGVRIEDNNILSPYEVRKCVYSLGAKPGVRKKSLDIKNIEYGIEKANDNVMWVKVRVEGSILNVSVKEKVTPPKIKNNQENEGIHPVVAKQDGEIVKIYCSSGNPVVNRGDYVKKGDVLIEGVQGKDEYQYEVQPEGTAIAKTLEEKTAKVKVKGTELKRTGEIYKDIYIEIFGKKIYLKKCDKTFKDYDKIENIRKFIKEVDYYPKKEVEITESEDNLINKKVEEIEKSVRENTERCDKIVNKIINKKNLESGEVKLNIVFVIERNIAVKE